MILPFILALNRAPVFPPQTLLIPFWWGVLNKSHFHAFIPHRLLLCRSGDADFQGASAAVWDPQWSLSPSSQPHYACTQTCPKHRQTGTFTHRPPQQHTVMALWSFGTNTQHHVMYFKFAVGQLKHTPGVHTGVLDVIFVCILYVSLLSCRPSPLSHAEPQRFGCDANKLLRLSRSVYAGARLLMGTSWEWRRYMHNQTKPHI